MLTCEIHPVLYQSNRKLLFLIDLASSIIKVKVGDMLLFQNAYTEGCDSTEEVQHRFFQCDS